MAAPAADRSLTDVHSTDIRYRRQSRELTVTFADGRVFSFTAEFLRVHSPSAEVKGHGAGEGKLIAARRHVGIMRIEPVGNYAVRLVFDDLHDTGIYSWRYLHELGQTQTGLWQDYLRRLAAAGLSRDPGDR